MMTPEAQRIAIAACGWYVHREGSVIYASHSKKPDFERRAFQCAPLVPNYTSDLNAMHEAEKLLPSETQYRDYIRALWMVVGRPSEHLAYFPMLHATASQRAEAFLRTIGKWKGE